MKTRTVVDFGVPLLWVSSFLWLATARGATSEFSVRVLRPSDPPFSIEVRRVLRDDRNLSFEILVNNISAHKLQEVTISGFIFSAGVRKGGFMFSREVGLDPQGTTTLWVSIPLRPLSISLEDEIFLVPRRASLVPLGIPPIPKVVGRLIWKVDDQTLFQAVRTYRLESSPLPSRYTDELQEIQVQRQARGVWTPDAPCLICQWCSQEAAGSCGNPMIQGSCRPPYACTAFYNCNCSSCSYACKPPDQCC